MCCYVYIKSFTVVNSVSTNIFKQQLKRFSPKQGLTIASTVVSLNPISEKGFYLISILYR